MGDGRHYSRPTRITNKVAEAMTRVGVATTQVAAAEPNTQQEE